MRVLKDANTYVGGFILALGGLLECRVWLGLLSNDESIVKLSCLFSVSTLAVPSKLLLFFFAEAS